MWRDLYAAMAEALRKRGIVEDASVTLADDSTLQRIGAALRCPKEFVPVQIGGRWVFRLSNMAVPLFLTPSLWQLHVRCKTWHRNRMAAAV